MCDLPAFLFLKMRLFQPYFLVIEEQKKRTFEEVTNRHWETRLAEWDKEKGRILNTLLGTDDTLNIGFLPFNKNKTKTTVAPGKRSLLDDNEMLYAQQVHKYNEMVVQGMGLEKGLKFRKLSDIKFVMLRFFKCFEGYSL